MRVEYLNPFISATAKVFEHSLGIKVEKKASSYLKPRGEAPAGLCAIVGMSGEARGTIVLRFSEGVGEKIPGGISKLASSISWLATTDLKSVGFNLEISVPVISHETFCLVVPADVPTIVVPFKSDLGDFFLEVSIKSPGPTS
ncbi:MAG: chemotaxis protein CheX [Planctomycetes bacterium]|nr:chemotaxis protein CheX [Planctomycetota bacterium]